MRSIIHRLKDNLAAALTGFILASVVVGLWAQEAQMINRPLVVNVGNATVTRGTLIAGGGLIRDYRPVTTISDTAAHTYTTTELLSGYILRSGFLTANRTDVLPTAANLIAALPGIQTGSSFTVMIDMTASPAYTMTLNGASTGVTYGGSCGTAVDTNDVMMLLINITSSTTYRVACAPVKNT